MLLEQWHQPIQRTLDDPLTRLDRVFHRVLDLLDDSPSRRRSESRGEIFAGLVQWPLQPHGRPHVTVARLGKYALLRARHQRQARRRNADLKRPIDDALRNAEASFDTHQPIGFDNQIRRAQHAIFLTKIRRRAAQRELPVTPEGGEIRDFIKHWKGLDPAAGKTERAGNYRPGRGWQRTLYTHIAPKFTMETQPPVVTEERRDVYSRELCPEVEFLAKANLTLRAQHTHRALTKLRALHEQRPPREKKPHRDQIRPRQRAMIEASARAGYFPAAVLLISHNIHPPQRARARNGIAPTEIHLTHHRG